jgi:hypothetical protein
MEDHVVAYRNFVYVMYVQRHNRFTASHWLMSIIKSYIKTNLTFYSTNRYNILITLTIYRIATYINYFNDIPDYHIL